DPGAAYTAVIQLGSVIAVIAYFAKDLLRIATGAFAAVQKKDYTSEEFRTAGAIVLGTIPVCIVGLLLKHLIEAPDGPFRSLYVIGGASIFMGLLLVAAEKLGSHQRGIETIAGRDGVLVGLGQCMALIPGCSRSGSTLTVAMLLNLKRADAARFSFLLGIPAIILSGLLELKEMLSQGLDQAHSVDLAIGLIISTIVSYLSIAWL